ncbi:unnamed protein product [Hydatigera taeniaeformis]|uniref:Uncharacterized protein n=1 Tax=Hydatigena taeniaeformis TaxID=6205 RepID=A0A0R3X3V3_HYDTA|nr:unnamed protein product [Hydatigera taeniaeformis]
MSTFKLIALDETSSHSHGTHRRDTDFLLTNGNVYALKVDPPPRTELVRLQQIFAPLKPDHPIPEYKPRNRPYQETFNSPTPVIEIGGNGDCSRDSDEMSNYNGDSDLSTKGEAVATKLNDIIQRMETKLYSSGDDDDPCVHNPLLEEKETFKEDPSQSTYIKTSAKGAFNTLLIELVRVEHVSFTSSLTAATWFAQRRGEVA